MVTCLSSSTFPSRLFEIQPELVNLFPFKDDALTDDNESLNKHALSVMETIDAAVHLLLDGDIPSLVDTLVELGISHGMNSVKPEHFAVSLCSNYLQLSS